MAEFREELLAIRNGELMYPCTQQNCKEEIFALHMCESHYQTWRRKIGLGPVFELLDYIGEFGEKFCPNCEQWLPSPRFTSNNVQCKDCHPPKINPDSLFRARWREDLLALQDGLCAICDANITGNSGGRSVAHLDHDHDCCPIKGARCCGQCIRGALCPDCNKGLGNFGDSVDKLLWAAMYLLDWNEKKNNRQMELTK